MPGQLMITFEPLCVIVMATDGPATTVTTKLHEAELPDASVTWKVLVVLPIGNELPLASPAIRAGGPASEQLSCANGAV